MKKSQQNQALWFLRHAELTLAELLPLCADQLNKDENSLDTTARDVERLIKRISDFRAEFTE